MNELIQIKGNTNFMGVNVPNIEGGFGEGQKVILAKTVAEIHNTGLKEINQSLKRLISKNRIKEGTHYIDLKSVTNSYPLLENLFDREYIRKSKNIFILSERGYCSLIKYMDDDKSWEIHEQFVDTYFRMKTELAKKDKLVLDIYHGGSKAIQSAKELIEMETRERTEKIKDGNDKVLTCGQVVDQLEISELTTTILNEWFCLNGFGVMLKKEGEKKRCFQPSEKFLQLIAKEGYSMTGKTQKGDKIRVVYTVGLVKELIDNYLDSIKSYTEIQIGKKIA